MKRKKTGKFTRIQFQQYFTFKPNWNLIRTKLNTPKIHFCRKINNPIGELKENYFDTRISLIIDFSSHFIYLMAI